MLNHEHMHNQLECILKNIAVKTKSIEKGGSFEPPPIRTDIIHYNTVWYCKSDVLPCNLCGSDQDMNKRVFTRRL